jgi:urease alpha subunit
LLINNLGPDTSDHLVITDTLASGTSFVSSKLTGGTGPSSCKTPATAQNAGTITCNWTGLAAHASINVTIQVKVNAAVGSTLVNTFKVRAQTQDLNLNNNGATFRTRVN